MLSVKKSKLDVIQIIFAYKFKNHECVKASHFELFLFSEFITFHLQELFMSANLKNWQAAVNTKE